MSEVGMKIAVCRQCDTHCICIVENPSNMPSDCLYGNDLLPYAGWEVLTNLDIQSHEITLNNNLINKLSRLIDILRMIETGERTEEEERKWQKQKETE